MAEPAHVWTAVRTFMRRSCGVVLSDEQSYLLEARLAPVAKLHQFTSLGDYVASACTASSSSPLAKSLVDAMTTHETFFFRDVPFWKAFEEVLLPQMIERAGLRPLRIWSAACSHGQEAFSIAMLLEERWPAVAAKAIIYGTDISAPAIERARLGVFNALEVNRGLGAARLLRHFEAHTGGFRIKQPLRDRVTWATGNLLGAQTDTNVYDAVLCRNVLIYFDDLDRQKVIERLFDATAPGGFIGLGSTEYVSKPTISPGWYANDRRKIKETK